MDQSDPDSGLRLAWIGGPLRKRLDETLELPLPTGMARLLAGCEVAFAGASTEEKKR